MDNVPSEMLRGHIDTIILLSLLNSDKHTGQIKEEIENRSDGKFELKQGTFYSCLQRIVKQGYVTEYRVSTPEGRKKFYQLTEKGKIYIDENKDRWCSSRSLIDTLIQTPSVMAELSVPSADARQAKNPVQQTQQDVADDEISPEDTLKRFLDGEIPAQSAESPETRKTEDVSTQTQAAVNADEEKTVTEEKHKEVKPGENYDIFSYMDNTQSFPIDEEKLKAETVAAKQSLRDSETVTTPDSPAKDEKIDDKAGSSVDTPTETKIQQQQVQQEIAVFADDTKDSGSATQDTKNFTTSDENQVEQTEYLSEEKTATREYKTVLARLFPEKKTETTEDSREMVYTEGADVNGFFRDTVTIDDEKLEELKEKARKKKNHTVIDSTVKSSDRIVDKKEKRHKSSLKTSYDFSDIKALADKEGFRVRISSAETRKDAGNILINKLIFHSSLAYFFIIAIETLIIGLTTSTIAKLNFVPYFVVVAVCALFPIVYGIKYMLEPQKKVSSIATFKSAIELIVIITLNLCLITFCCCIFAEIDFSDPAILMKCVFYPLLFLLDLPIYTFIKYLKLDNQKYFS